MPKNISVQSSFIRGLITEATGLNFPENAATDTSNCVFSLIGDVTRRPGINFEENFTYVPTSVNTQAVSNYRWLNAGGDGESEILVQQVGNSLYFFLSSASTIINPLSHQSINSLNFASFQATGNTDVVANIECQFSAGNGYLFVYHPSCDPFYVTFNPIVKTITYNKITVSIRDFNGFYPEPGNPAIQNRPSTLIPEHQYNLQNQGWTGAPVWSANYTTNSDTVTGNPQLNLFAAQNGTLAATLGNNSFVIPTGLSITAGAPLNLTWSVPVWEFAGGFFIVPVSGTAAGNVVSYNSGNGLTVINITQASKYTQPGTQIFGDSGTVGVPYASPPQWTIIPGITNNTINTFKSAAGVYPSDGDIWWTFKDDTDLFNPSVTYGSVSVSSTPAPRGFYIYNAFKQNKSEQANISALTDINTSARPSTGTWFQGRVWYAGVNSSQAPSGDQGFYTWTENIYFSQIITPGDTTAFGYCYQQNDPTDETLFDILPTDGGVITIAGCGDVYKLFPIQNGMLVFAANGVWFITGSSGIGFTATDYTITKISSVKSISSTSFIDVLGLPFFWNEEGIYRVTPAQQQGLGLAVEPLTVGTILSFYNQIPLDSKVYVRGDYDPNSYVIKWIYRSTQETGLLDRYKFDSVLNFNIYNKSFYPYDVSYTEGVTPSIAGIFYLNYPNSLTAPDPGFKYLSTSPFLTAYTFAEENDYVTWLDWNSVIGQNYTSFFTTGYNLHGKGIFKWQPTYVYVFSRNDQPFAYTLQGVWDYAVSPNSGKFSSIQTVNNRLGQPNFGMLYRRHKIRGHGMVLQLTVSSVQGEPFDIMGWTIFENIDAGV